MMKILARRVPYFKHVDGLILCIDEGSIIELGVDFSLGIGLYLYDGF